MPHFVLPKIPFYVASYKILGKCLKVSLYAKSSIQTCGMINKILAIYSQLELYGQAFKLMTALTGRVQTNSWMLPQKCLGNVNCAWKQIMT